MATATLGAEGIDDADEPSMKTLLIEWTEVSRHRATVQVLSDTNPDGIDLENRLADLADDGFLGLQREIESVATTNHDGACSPSSPPAGLGETSCAEDHFGRRCHCQTAYVRFNET